MTVWAWHFDLLSTMILTLTKAVVVLKGRVLLKIGVVVWFTSNSLLCYHANANTSTLSTIRLYNWWRTQMSVNQLGKERKPIFIGTVANRFGWLWGQDEELTYNAYQVLGSCIYWDITELMSMCKFLRALKSTKKVRASLFYYGTR
jgi:hypothetical protein